MVSETELARLKAYRGVSAIPDDFDEFWDERMAEADAARGPARRSSVPGVGGRH